jgi:hypothetical protein
MRVKASMVLRTMFASVQVQPARLLPGPFSETCIGADDVCIDLIKSLFQFVESEAIRRHHFIRSPGG